MASIRLKELRDAHRLNQADVAAHLQIARTTYARYENGEREMPYASLILLAEYFSVSIDYLLGRYDANPMILNKDEVALVELYRIIDERGQRSVRSVAEHEFEQIKEKKGKAVG